MKTTGARERFPPYKLLARETSEAPSNIKALASAVCKTIARDTMWSGYSTGRNKPGTEVKVFFLLAVFHSARRCCVHCWKKTVTGCPAQLWSLHAIVPNAKQGVHDCAMVTWPLWDNQQLPIACDAHYILETSRLVL